MSKGRKPKGKVVDMIRRPQWYRMQALFDGRSKKVADLEGQDVLIRGVKYRGTITCGKCGHGIKANLLTARSDLRNGIKELIQKTREKVLDSDLLKSVLERMEELTKTTGGEDKLDLDPELAICVVPTAILEEQGEVLRRMLEANLRMPVLLLTDNAHMVKLKPISGQVAKEIMEETVDNSEPGPEPEEDAKIIQLAGRQGPEKGEGGEEIEE